MLIVIGVNINTFYYFIYQAVHASGKIKKQQILTTISYLVSVGVIYLSFKMGASFYYAAIIPIIFSFVRNFIVIISAVETIYFNVKHYFSSVILPCAVLVLALILTPLLLTYFMESSLLRLVMVLTSNTFLLAVLGYFLVLNKEEIVILSSLLLYPKKIGPCA
jgi:hypothetical protein